MQKLHEIHVKNSSHVSCAGPCHAKFHVEIFCLCHTHITCICKKISLKSCILLLYMLFPSFCFVSKCSLELPLCGSRPLNTKLALNKITGKQVKYVQVYNVDDFYRSTQTYNYIANHHDHCQTVEKVVLSTEFCFLIGKSTIFKSSMYHLYMGSTYIAK